MLLLRGDVVQEALWQRFSCIQHNYLQGMKCRQVPEGNSCSMAALHMGRGCMVHHEAGLGTCATWS